MAIARGLATTGDVQDILYFRDFLSNCLNSVRPDVDDIESAIDTGIDIINMHLLTAGYTLPIILADSPYGYNFVKYLNALGTAVAIERRWGAAEHHKRLNEEYIGIIDDIENARIVLTDVPGAPVMGDLAKSGTSELTASGEEREPFFTRDDTF